MNFLDLVFPKKCVGCDKTGRYFCLDCETKIKKIFQICPVCERATPFGQTHEFCLTRYFPDGLFSFFNYEGIIREAIHQLKYKYVTDLEKEFWQVIKNQIQKDEEKLIVLTQFFKQEKPIVVPIPLYWHKQRIRGFNQSSLFAKRLSLHFNLPYSDKILARRRNVQSQTKLTQKEREQNVKEIFKINPNYLSAGKAGKLLITNCLLVDDVWTTGSTMKEATKVLKENGVKKVWGLTVAR